MATDEEAYKAFGDLFGPIIKDLHPKFDFRFSYKFEELKVDLFSDLLEKSSKAIEKIKSYKIMAKRNFKNTPFTPLMSKESKLQIQKRIVEILGILNGKYIHLNHLEESDKNWLSSIGISVERNTEHDAAGINDDWPIGRGVYI